MRTVRGLNAPSGRAWRRVALLVATSALLMFLASVPSAFAAAPVAVDDTATVLGKDILVAPSVLVNDTDGDNDVLVASVETTPTHGVLLFNIANGAYTYTPDTGFFGTDTFTYTVSDGNGGTDTATVTIAVTGDMWVSTTGSDITGDGSQADPFATVARAMSAIASGYTIHVGGGTFACLNLLVKNDVSIEGAGASEPPSWPTARVGRCSSGALVRARRSQMSRSLAAESM